MYIFSTLDLNYATDSQIIKLCILITLIPQIIYFADKSDPSKAENNLWYLLLVFNL
jgi:hypothetical protein